jgi:exodeoxyribonuclease V gamma subunit
VYDIDVPVGSERRLTGTVAEVFAGRTVAVSYSTLDCRHVLQAWIALVALAAQEPGREWAASCIGRRKKPDGIVHRMLTAPAEPVPVLRDLVRLFDAGRCETLPLPLRTSYAWVEARDTGGDPLREARYRWKSNDHYPGEDADLAHQHIWGPKALLEAILGTPRPGEEVAGENTRLGALAARLWRPLIAAERDVD